VENCSVIQPESRWKDGARSAGRFVAASSIQTATLWPAERRYDILHIKAKRCIWHHLSLAFSANADQSFVLQQFIVGVIQSCLQLLNGLFLLSYFRNSQSSKSCRAR
jgi:hypothetical protein